mgnify:CR=1 FL=1
MMSATPATPGETVPGRRAWRLDGRTSARVRTFLSWWGAALSSWLPARVRERFGLASRRLLLHGDAGEIALHLQDADGYADRHWPVGHGNLNWRAIFDRLSVLTSSPRLIIEIRDKSQIQASAAYLANLGLAQ